MQKVNYHKLMLEELERIRESGKKPRLLMHSCCAPCSIYVFHTLAKDFDLEVYYFNPNIHPEAEYRRRFAEQEELVEKMNLPFKITCPPYEPKQFYNAVRGHEHLGEKSSRCEQCFTLRLEDSAIYAKANNFDYLGTALTISPHKNSILINQIGLNLEKKYGVKFFVSDFKKNNGFKIATDLAKKYELYRQCYCGCSFSLKETNRRIE